MSYNATIIESEWWGHKNGPQKKKKNQEDRIESRSRPVYNLASQISGGKVEYLINYVGTIGNYFRKTKIIILIHTIDKDLFLLYWRSNLTTKLWKY